MLRDDGSFPAVATEILTDRRNHQQPQQQQLRTVRTVCSQPVSFPDLTVFAGICGECPVVVLTASVDAFERLFMEQARETMVVSYLLHHLHDELVVVNGNIDGLKYRSKFMLSSATSFVLSLRDSKLPEFFV